MSLIEDCFRQAIAAAVDGDRDAFVSLEAKDDEEKWVQFTYEMINASYPLEQEPERMLKERSITFPPNVEVVGWEAGKYVTFEHGGEPMGELVRFVEEYLFQVLGIATPETSLHVVEEEF